MTPERRDLALATKGFMPANEGDALWDAAVAAGHAVPGAPMLEVGSYCGRSTIWLGDAAESVGVVLFAVDHHRGSEENQAGWDHHDTEVVDARIGKMDTLPFFRAAIHDAQLEDSVIAVVGRSPLVAATWTTPLSFLFIDGGHGEEPARLDYEGWTPHVAVGGTLAIHDVFPDPVDGGRPPYEQIFKPALESGRFRMVSATGSLRVLHRVD
ncbi:MAG TPA: class I SAM-dependent methyltransferase [Ilumatobacteraceae bacterium]|nr:class I SAM-dependent methyltransferase [Ilumatobacteraceae bacterium]